MVIRSARGNQSGAAAGVRLGIIRASANRARSDFMPLIVRGLTQRRKRADRRGARTRQGAPHDDPYAFRPGARLGADVVLYGGDEIESGQRGAEFTQAGFKRLDVCVDQARENGLAAEVDYLRPRRALFLQDGGTSAVYSILDQQIPARGNRPVKLISLR